MQLTNTVFPDTASFIETDCGKKVHFLAKKKYILGREQAIQDGLPCPCPWQLRSLRCPCLLLLMGAGT
jgi:hypothetical protein